MDLQNGYDHLLTHCFSLFQLKAQASYRKDTTNFINFIENTKVKNEHSLYRWMLQVYIQIYHMKRV